ncbi:toll-like receptor 5 [Hemicordylus capensis]|uniref:toll-like receptor 5 n=1 Tax=Hemicordylus capensis TaxID=884348 RepID=UPI002302AFA7|nr:toll-like receptor 5 [Hemicordylus capensis]
MLGFHVKSLLCGARSVSICTTVLLLAAWAYADDAPPRCQHTVVNSRLVANCQAQRHKEVPDIDPAVQVLLLNFNLFSAILDASLPWMASLQTLSLGSQQGGSLFVGGKAFRNVANITFLDLGGNRNVTLHPDAFAGLARLEVLLLDVDGFDDGVLEHGYFRDLVSLKRLDLTGNRIRSLRPDPTFRGLGKLSFLQLKLNRIQVIGDSDLQHLQGRHLALLDLSSNRLLSQPTCTNPFRNITLGTLDISSNALGAAGAERFFLCLNGTRIQNLKMQHSATLGSGFGFRNLKGISASTFSGLRHSGTFSFDMSHGFLSELVSSAFSAFPDLHTLLLRSNQITKIWDGAFAGLGQLRDLDLSDNLLGELYTEALQTLRSSPLQRLTLKSNHIGAVQQGALEGLRSLQILDLQDNALSRVPMGRLPSLRLLVLRQNRIRDAWGIERLAPNLTHLDFSSNRLSSLDQLWAQLGGIPTLLFLDVSGNQLSRCSRVQDGPRLLRELDLSQNHLARVWTTGGCVAIFQHLESLTLLNLSSNSLQALPEGLFQGLASLRTLDLSANFLPTLPEKIFLGLHSLNTIRLQGNPLVTISLSTFRPLVLLRSLDLQELALLCHCGLADFQSWLQEKEITLNGAVGTPRCILTTPFFRRVPLPQFLRRNCARYCVTTSPFPQLCYTRTRTPGESGPLAGTQSPVPENS